MLSDLRRHMIWLAPVVSTGIAATCYAAGFSVDASLCAWVALLCALWWIFESLHIAIVGLVPFVAFPLFGILSHSRVATSYGHSMILLMMGGFFLSAAMERSGAHRRVAVTMVRAVGGRGGPRLVLGFMLATSILSMWISNAATTLMMLPIAMAVLSQVRDDELRVPLLLGIAYSASIGGMATPIGTPPNVIFMSLIQKDFQLEVTFMRWMSYGVPIVILLLPIIWWWLTRKMTGARIIELPEVGHWRSSEKRVLAVFCVTALLWIFRASPFGGWSGLLPGGGDTVGDATVALAGSLALFLMPAGERLPGSVPANGDAVSDRDSHSKTIHSQHAVADQPLNQPLNLPGTSRMPTVERILDWPTATRIPWGILIMFGGGLALADGFEQTGLSQTIGGWLSVFAGAPPWAIVLAVCLVVTFLTEITSSTATAMLLLPILGELASATGINPVTIMIPGTISCSCAFMLPVATAPNVIVFGAGGIRTDEMARSGFVLNLIAAVLITIVTLLVSGTSVFQEIR